MHKRLEAEPRLPSAAALHRQLLPDSVVAEASRATGSGPRPPAASPRWWSATGCSRASWSAPSGELIEREGVSRRRAPGGGPPARAPPDRPDAPRARRRPVGSSRAQAREIVAIYLARRGMRLADLAELRTGVEWRSPAWPHPHRSRRGGAPARGAGARSGQPRRRPGRRRARRPRGRGRRGAQPGAGADRAGAHRLSRYYEIKASRRRAARTCAPRCCAPTRPSRRPLNQATRSSPRHRMRRHLDALAAVMR